MNSSQAHTEGEPDEVIYQKVDIYLHSCITNTTKHQNNSETHKTVDKDQHGRIYYRREERGESDPEKSLYSSCTEGLSSGKIVFINPLPGVTDKFQDNREIVETMSQNDCFQAV